MKKAKAEKNSRYTKIRDAHPEHIPRQKRQIYRTQKNTTLFLLFSRLKNSFVLLLANGNGIGFPITPSTLVDGPRSPALPLWRSLPPEMDSCIPESPQ